MNFSILRLFSLIHIIIVLVITAVIIYWQSSLIKEFHNTQIKNYFDQINKTFNVFLQQEKTLVKNTIQSNVNNNKDLNIENIDFNNIDFVIHSKEKKIINTYGYSLFIEKDAIKDILEHIVDSNFQNKKLIHKIHYKGTDYFFLVHSESLINKDLGKIEGSLFGIELINKNQFLLNQLKDNLNLISIYLVNKKNQIVASSSRSYNFDMRNISLNKVYTTSNTKGLYLRKQLSEELDILYVIDNTKYQESLNEQFEKLETLFYIFITIGFLAYLIIKYGLVEKLRYLRTFIQDTLQNQKTTYKKSGIVEIDNTANDFYQLFTTYDKKEKLFSQQSKQAALGEMIGNIAHQWRQPLSTISLHTDIIKQVYENNLDDKSLVKDSANDIKKNIKYLTDTVDIFLDFVKNEKKHQEVFIKSEIDQAKYIVKSSMQRNSINIIDNINYSDKDKIDIRKGELAQVIVNLLNNSKDVLLERKINSPWIKIELNNEENFYIISLEDNGQGIDGNKINKVFDPYFTTKFQSQGTGIGLYMSYKIITENLNGNIQVENTNNGAKFTIEIPINNIK
jgi:signal transduction histidine kinase